MQEHSLFLVLFVNIEDSRSIIYKSYQYQLNVVLPKRLYAVGYKVHTQDKNNRFSEYITCQHGHNLGSRSSSQ
jgi:hypothetical protein